MALAAIVFAAFQLQRRGTTDRPPSLAPAAPALNWQPLFDIVKELNNNAGRLAALLAVIVAAASITATNGPVHDALTTLDLDHSLVYVALLLLAVATTRGLASALYALDPTLPKDLLNPTEWGSLIELKAQHCRIAKRSMVIAAIALFGAWTAAYAKPPFGGWAIPLGLAIIQLALFLEALVVASRRSRGEPPLVTNAPRPAR